LCLVEAEGWVGRGRGAATTVGDTL
jgi:hypothetical protein